MVATPVGAEHEVLRDLDLPRDPRELEFGALLSGVSDPLVLARYARTANAPSSHRTAGSTRANGRGSGRRE